MHLLGNKDQARKLAKKAGVPVVPGSDGLITSEEEALRFAKAVGFPVLIKAAAGGGGRGMRVARDEASLKSGLNAARREAESAFKDGSVYLERYIDRPRHIEVQLFGDRQGNVVHLWERECSLQRRHQKLVEESPAPNLPDAVRKEICASAVRLAKTAGYQNAGTCEFLVDAQDRFYFIEVNARIQVEHPVTELVTGIDLVKEQIRVAAGEPLSFRQEDVDAPRLRDGVPHQRRGPRRRLPAVAGPGDALAAARRSRRPARFARHDRLPHPAQLRLAGGQAAGLAADPHGGPGDACAAPWPSSWWRASKRRSRACAKSSTTPISSPARWTRRSSSGRGRAAGRKPADG